MKTPITPHNINKACLLSLVVTYVLGESAEFRRTGGGLLLYSLKGNTYSVQRYPDEG